MGERIRVATRRASASEGDARKAAPGPSILRQAIADARAVLPARDPSRNGAVKLAAHLACGVPATYALLATALLSLGERELRLLLDHPGKSPALVFACVAFSALAPLVLPALSAFPLALGFYALQGEATRSRLHQALVCPFCRDEVGRDGAVVCARERCGALYHEECWRECATHYGGCAIYGCSSKKSREVSAAGYAFRLARLVVAAVLFPPKVARAIRGSEGEGLRAIYRKAVKRAEKLVVGDARDIPLAKVLLYMFVYVPIAYALVIAIMSRASPSGFSNVFRDCWWATPLLFVLSLAVPAGLPWAIAFPPALAFYFARAVARAFRSELAALARADEGGATVLGRLRLRLGSKK